MLLPQGSIGHIHLHDDHRYLYLSLPRGATPDWGWLESARLHVELETTGIAPVICYRLAGLRTTANGQVTADLLPHSKSDRRSHDRRVAKDAASVRRIVLTTAAESVALERGPRGLYRVAA